MIQLNNTPYILLVFPDPNSFSFLSEKMKASPRPRPVFLHRDDARRPRGAGFSLVEVMIAAGVLAMGLAVAVIALQISLRDHDLARTNTAITQILQNEVERLRMLEWEDLSDPDKTAPNVDAMKSNGRLPGRDFLITTTIINLPSPPAIKEMEIQARWTGTSGTTHTRKAIIHYAKDGLYETLYKTGTVFNTQE